jgi:hypothetical protein
VSGAYIRTPDFVLMTSGSYGASTCFFFVISCLHGRTPSGVSWLLPLLRPCFVTPVFLFSRARTRILHLGRPFDQRLRHGFGKIAFLYLLKQ